MRRSSPFATAVPVPDWVPHEARVYLAHTEQGCSMREIARSAGCHASTVLRHVRRVETRRDDLLVDEALRRLSAALPQTTSHQQGTNHVNATREKAPETANDTGSDAAMKKIDPR